MVLKDKRLLAAADYANKGESCVDVGTDHGYLSVFLYQSKIAGDIVACDINEKPLEAAKKTFIQNGLENNIALRISDGLSNIKSEEAKNIFICGMGGELILKILLEAPFDLTDSHNIILQPMTNIPLLRKGLYENGFEIISETPVIDARHFYTVMQVKKVKQAKDMQNVKVSDLFAYVGKIPQSNSPDKKEYLTNMLSKLLKIIASLERAKSEDLALEYYKSIASGLKAVCAE